VALHRSGDAPELVALTFRDAAVAVVNTLRSDDDALPITRRPTAR
jgi:hypothetical protein